MSVERTISGSTELFTEKRALLIKLFSEKQDRVRHVPV